MLQKRNPIHKVCVIINSLICLEIYQQGKKWALFSGVICIYYLLALNPHTVSRGHTREGKFFNYTGNNLVILGSNHL